MADAHWSAALTANGLPGARPVGALPPIGELLSTAAEHKLLGVLAAAVADGAIELTPDDRGRVGEAHEGAMREVLLLEEMLLEAVAVLDGAGIDYRVLKGAALAHTVHDNPAERCFGDNDVLVASAHIDAAIAALVAAGATRPVPALSASFDRRFAKSITLGWIGGTELDLHRTLAPGPYGHLIPLDELYRDPVEVLLAGRAVHTLPPQLHLLHAAIHVALGDVDARLGNVRDLALLAAWPSVDADEVVDAAIRWGCAAPIALGLRTTATLGLSRTSLEQWADDYVISNRDRRLLTAYGQSHGRYRRQARASWRVLGWSDRLAFARALVRPSAANRAARGRG